MEPPNSDRSLAFIRPTVRLPVANHSTTSKPAPAIGNLWAKMLQITGEAKYGDVLEWCCTMPCSLGKPGRQTLFYATRP